MAAPLILDSLEIRGFRAFNHLVVNRLGRINLIVGKNNVGKSCFLDALQIYARRGAPSVLSKSMEDRDEGALPGYLNGSPTKIERTLALRHLFHGRNLRKGMSYLHIGPIDCPDKVFSMSIEFDKLAFQRGAEAGNALHIIMQFGGQGALVPATVTPIREELSDLGISLAGVHSVLPSVFVPSNGLSPADLAELWDRVTLTVGEEDVLLSLRIIAPQVRGVSFVQHPVREKQRAPMVKLMELNEPLALRSVGEGMNRLLGLSLGAVNSRDGLLLVDEIDTGLHYSVLTNVWRLLFQTARRLNIQVFATTHSWDCIEAFDEAARESKEEGLLIRLERKKDDIVATLFDESEIDIATRNEIEVR